MAKESRTLHFTLGENFGVVLTNLAQEHIQYNYNLKKGIDAIETGLVGISREIVLDVLSGKKVIIIDGDGCILTEWIDGHEKLGYRKFNASEWADDQIEELVKQGEGLNEAMDMYINELRNKKNGHINIDFNSSSLMKYIFEHDDSDMLMEIEDELQPYRQLQLIVDAFLTKAKTILKCIGELYQLGKTEECKGKDEWTIDIPPTLQTVLNLSYKIKELAAITRIDKVERKQETSVLDSFLAAQHEIDKVEEEGIKPSDISNNLDAYWLAPNGDAYGLNGEIANMLHNSIADMLVDAGIITLDEDDLDMADTVMMRNGWLKLHNGEVLGDHVYHEILITQQQKDALIKYAEAQVNTILYMNYRIMNQYISKARLENMELQALTNMLDIGLKKDDSKWSKPIKNMRDNPNYFEQE